jgi:Arc/MetJ family transcription regulator
MRTNIVIDDDLMEAAIAATGARSKREAVERGLHLLIARARQASIKPLRGTIAWEGNLDDMRRDDTYAA